MTATSGMLLGKFTRYYTRYYTGLKDEVDGKMIKDWEIINYDVCKHSTVYESPPFTYGNTSWCIQMSPPKSLDDFLRVRLRNLTKVNCRLEFSFSIRKGRFRGEEERVSRTSFINGSTYYNFLTGHFLHEVKLEYLVLNTMNITCELEIVSPGGVRDLKRKLMHTSEHMNLAGLESLSKHLKGLFANKDNCDAVLIVQGEEFKVHKYILAARSSVFDAMFKHDTVEKRTGKVDISDCDPKSFQDFLQYLYCGKIETISSNNVFQLYKTADKYNVKELKAYCVNYLMQSLTAENVFDIFEFAEEYNETHLFALAQECFNENFEKILKTPEWENLCKNNFPFMTKILTEMAKNKK